MSSSEGLWNVIGSSLEFSLCVLAFLFHMPSGSCVENRETSEEAFEETRQELSNQGPIKGRSILSCLLRRPKLWIYFQIWYCFEWYRHTLRTAHPKTGATLCHAWLLVLIVQGEWPDYTAHRFQRITHNWYATLKNFCLLLQNIIF